MAFGRELQQERERRGISIDAIAEATKVAARYLRALESDDLASLPGGVFNKGFVRSYCRFVGLNEDEWLARMASTPHSNGNDADWAVFAENVKRNRERIRPGMRRRWWGVVLMLVVLGAVGWAMWRYVLRTRVITDPLPPRASLVRPSAPTAFTK